MLGERMIECTYDVFLTHQGREVARSPLARENLITHAPHIKQKMKVASLTPGTCSKWLWLLPSGPDQVHHPAMRGDPPARMIAQGRDVPDVYPHSLAETCIIGIGGSHYKLRPSHTTRHAGPHRAVGMVEVVHRQTLLNTPGFTISSSAKLIVSLPDHRRASPTPDIWRASHRNI